MFLAVCQDYRLPLAALVEPTVDFELLASSPVRGPALIKELGSALVRQQLHLQASVDSLCAVLRDRSPTFFSPADVLVYEGTDALERGLKHPSRAIREQLFSESLHCFLRAALPAEAAVDVMEKYRSARFFSGILALAESNTTSLKERALNCLEDLLASPHDEEETGAVFSQVLSSKSAELRVAFYDWLFQHSIAGAVLLSTPAFSRDLFTYLEAGAFEAAEDGNLLMLKSKARADICWKYLARHVRPAESGRVLVRLARSLTQDSTLDHVTLPLEERIQCLSMAVATLKASGAEVAAAEAGEAEELLEVALVQLELLNALKRMDTGFAAQVQLHGRLFDLTTLFVEFSEPLGLSDISLLIVHTAGHADVVLVSRLWQRLLTSAGAGLDAVQRAVVSLAAKIFPSPVAFPLAYLVDMLALLACKAIASAEEESRMANWFTGTWRQAGVPLDQVKSVLNDMLQKSALESFWSTPERKRFLRLLLAAQ